MPWTWEYFLIIVYTYYNCSNSGQTDDDVSKVLHEVNIYSKTRNDVKVNHKATFFSKTRDQHYSGAQPALAGKFSAIPLVDIVNTNGSEMMLSN